MTTLEATAAPVAGRVAGAPSPNRRSEAREAYGLVAPNVALLAIFVLIPLGTAVAASFQQTDGYGPAQWIGFANYSRLISDSVFWRATGNTVLFTALVTPVSMGLGLAAALLFNTVLPARGVFRSILILPMAVSGVATALLGVLIYDQNSGLLNKLLDATGLPTVDWQSHGVPAFASVALTTVWWRVGFNMLIYLAGLQGIGAHLGEAARLDGASPWQQFRYVTLPMLGPTSFFLVIINIVYSFQVFDIIFVLTNGGPQHATSVLVTYAYDTGFVTRDQGYAATIGLVLLIFTILFTAARWRMNNKDVSE